MEQIAGRPFWAITFDGDGALTAPDRAQLLAEIAGSGVTELFVMSHGWSESTADATSLYQGLFPLVNQTAAAAPKLGPIGFVGLYWPSLWFPDPPAEAADAVSQAVRADRPGAADAALSGQQITSTLRASFTGPGQQSALETMGKLIDDGAAAAGKEPDEKQQARLDEFHGLLKQLVAVPAQGTTEDSGETSVLSSTDPRTDYGLLSDKVGSTPDAGSAQSLGDVFRKVWNGAKDVLRVGSYYEMKNRAGTVGQTGLGPLLEELHQQTPSVRVHLMGHSFGARLVSFALAGISTPDASPVASLTLIQGAFSHWSFSSELAPNPFGKPGGLHDLADRVHGALVATFSEHDWAVGKWYPKASFLAQQNLSDKEVADRWGGMGSDGFQAVAPQDCLDLLDDGIAYGLTPRTFYSVNGSGIIADTTQSSFAGAHSDIQHPQVAWLAVSAAESAAVG